jgi:hypothetical protein
MAVDLARAFVVGVDFGALSCRTLLVRQSTTSSLRNIAPCMTTSALVRTR